MQEKSNWLLLTQSSVQGTGASSAHSIHCSSLHLMWWQLPVWIRWWLKSTKWWNCKHLGSMPNLIILR